MRERVVETLASPVRSTRQRDGRYAAVALTSAHTGIEAIGCYTRTGRTAGILSSLRPHVPVIAFSPEPDVVAGLSLVNAVIPRLCSALGESDRIGELDRLLVETRLVAAGTTVVLVSSTATPGAAPNLLGVHRMTRPPAPDRTSED